jgi:hypothetical protein
MQSTTAVCARWCIGWKSHFLAHPYGNPVGVRSVGLAQELPIQNDTFGFLCEFMLGAPPHARIRREIRHSARRGQRCGRASHDARGEAQRDVGVLRWLRRLAQAQDVLQVPLRALLRMWPAHKASCKAWRKDAGGQAED